MNRRSVTAVGALYVLSLVLLPAMRAECGARMPPGGNRPQTTANLPTVTLAQLINEAITRNPAIMASHDAADARRELIAPAKTLPDPTFGFNNMGNLIPPTLQDGDPSSARTFSIEQEIPFPGKLGLRGKMAEMEAEAEKWNYEQTRRQVVADLKTAYYDFYLIAKSIETLRNNQELLQQLAAIAEEKYRVGEGIQQDVLRAHVEISKLIDRLTVLEQRRGSAEAQINGLVYRPAGTVLGAPEEIEKTELRRSLEELNRLAENNFPALKVQERAIDRNEYAVELARKEFFPDFSLGFTYFDRTVPEMYGLAVNVKIPLYFWRKQENELRSAKLDLESSRKQRENIVALLHAKIKDAHLVVGSSDKLIDLYEHNVIPQAQLSLESAVANYQVGNSDFLTLIDSFITLLDYQLKYYEVLTDYQKALAQLEPYVGIELTR